MEAAVAQAMEEGALGLSTSLIYMPDNYATTEEIIALAKVAARYGGSYITHQRNEGDDAEGGIDQSLDEVFRIAREAGIPAEIYHLKASGRASWGRMPHILKRIEAARAEGLDVSADQYPWTASSNNLDASLPMWVREGGEGPLVARLTDPATRARAQADFLKSPENKDWPEGATRVLITSVLNPELKSLEGKTLADIAREQKKEPLDALVDIVVADRGHTGRVTFGMSEDDVRAALRHPLVSFCTDSSARAEDGIFSREKSHPRAWGSASRILGTLRARREAAAARGSGPQDDVAARLAHALRRPRHRAARLRGRPGRVRSRERPRALDLRRPAPLQRGHPVRAGERAARRGRGAHHRRAPRPHPARARLPRAAPGRTVESV